MTEVQVHSPLPQHDEINQALGDLTTLPDPDRALWDQDVHGLEVIIQSGHCPPADLPTMEEMVRFRMEVLKGELAAANPFANAWLVRETSPQIRLRPDFTREDQVVEQYIPHLRIWLTFGRFAMDHDLGDIIYQVQKGDPRHQTATQHYEARQVEATANRATLDQASTDRVLAAVNDLSPARRDRFIAVEEALKSGETISARGDDRAEIERGIALTKSAAARGETEAQQVLLHGRSDNAMCDNPGSNPLTR